jgi:hypothetical protein
VCNARQNTELDRSIEGDILLGSHEIFCPLWNPNIYLFHIIPFEITNAKKAASNVTIIQI